MSAQNIQWPDWPDWAPGFTGDLTFVGGVAGLEAEPGPITTADTYATADRCMAHAFSVPSQGLHVSGSGLHVSGSTGGLVIGDVIILDENSVAIDAAQPRYPAAFMQDASGEPPAATFRGLLEGALDSQWRSPGRTVVVLVADDFAGGEYTIPDAVFTLTPDDKATLEDLVNSGDLSHGAVVLHHLNSLIAGSELFTLYPDSRRQDGEYVWLPASGLGDRVIVKALDLRMAGSARITSSDISLGLLAGVERLRGLLPQDDDVHLVVNMSWVLLPCETVDAFTAAKADFVTFESYLAALQIPGEPPPAADDPVYTANVLRLLSWVGPDDPLFQLVHGSPGSGSGVPFGLFESAKVAFVAAAGNFGMDYQMVPAAWPLVVGAGAPRGQQPAGLEQEPPPFTNAAEVAAPSAWFLLQRSPVFDDPAASAEPDSVVSYAGTSFAAPMVSLFTAVDLLAGPVARCSPDDVRARLPGLAADPPENRWLGEAADHCPYP